MSIFINLYNSKPSLIQHFKKKISTFINFEQKFENNANVNRRRICKMKMFRMRMKKQKR